MKRDVRKNREREEKTFLVLLSMIFVAGVVGQGLWCEGFISLRAEDLANASSLVIQIQTVLIGLTISLVSLISGRANETYLGIRITDYYMNMRFIFLTQKWITSACLCFLILNIALHLIGWYITVFAIALASCVAVWCSIDGIFLAFSGARDRDGLFQNELTYICETGDNEEIKRSFERLCKDWCNKTGSLGLLDKEQYHQAYCVFAERMFRTGRLRPELQRNAAMLLRFFLKEENERVTAFDLFSDTYLLASRVAAENKGALGSKEKPFELFRDIYYDVGNALKKMDVRDTEKYDWFYLVENMIDTELCFGSEEENEPDSGSQIWGDFGSFLGAYVAKRSERNSFRWGLRLRNISDSNEWVTEEKDLAGKRYLDFLFGYITSLIRFDDSSLLSDNFFGGRYSYTSGPRDDKQIMLVLKVQCYLWFLSYYAESPAVKPEVKQRALDYVENKIVKIFFDNYISMAIADDRSFAPAGMGKWVVFNSGLPDKMLRELQPYEFPPIDDVTCSFVMDRAVYDYVLLLGLYYAEKYENPDILKSILSEEIYYSYYISCRNEKDVYLSRIQLFFEMFDRHTESTGKTYDESYQDLLYYLGVLYKNYYLSVPLPSGIEKSEGELFSAELQNDIMDILWEKFGDLVDESILPDISFYLLRLNLDVDYKPRHVLNNSRRHVVNNFMIQLATILDKHGSIETVKKSEFPDDEALLRFLESCREKLVLGAEYLLMPADWRKRKQVRSIITTTDSYLTEYGTVTMILKQGSFSLNLGDVSVDCKNAEIEQSDAKYNPETDLYSYSFVNGAAVDLTREELNGYLEKKRRTYEINIQVGIRTAPGNIGVAVIP